jgi:hypothetical protein
MSTNVSPGIANGGGALEGSGVLGISGRVHLGVSVLVPLDLTTGADTMRRAFVTSAHF